MGRLTDSTLDALSILKELDDEEAARVQATLEFQRQQPQVVIEVDLDGAA